MRIGSNNKLEGIKCNVKNIIIHPKYIKTQYSIYDIVLIELINEIQMNISFANSVCIPSSGVVNERIESVVFSGWGQTGISGDRPTNTLKKAYYNLLPPNECKYKTRYLACVNQSQDMACSVSLIHF